MHIKDILEQHRNEKRKGLNSLCMQTREKETDRKTKPCLQQAYDQNCLWEALTAASW